jgi:RNA polymerase sigma factor (sigma-70 family)
MHCSERPIALNAVIRTEQLRQRLPHQSDYEAESRARVSLAQAVVHPPHDILQRLAEATIDLCQAGSAGISIIEGHLGEQVFRWHALTGALASHRWETTPRDFSPCGTVIDRKAVQLMILPERHFLYLTNVKPQVVEVLLVPFSVGGQLVGTIWVVAHDEHRQFDAEDERLVHEMARLTAEAYQLAASVEASKIADRRNDGFLATVAHELRTPLSAIHGRALPTVPRPRPVPSLRVPAVNAEDNSASLLRRMRSGDQGALAELYGCTVDSVYALAQAILKSAEDAEEVVCDTYAQAWRQSERFDPERASPIGWLMMMCRSRAIDRLRQNRSRGSARTVALESVRDLTHDSITPGDLLSLFHHGSRVQGALASLSPQRLHLVSLAFFEGLSFPELAERTGMPLGTVKSHVRRALVELRRTLES